MEIPVEDADRAAVQQVLAGDVEAFEGIVRRWQGPLVNLAYRYCRDSGRAEEMAQEAFLRVFRFLGKWRQDAAFSTWLFAVAANVYRSKMRRIVPPSVSLEHAAAIADPAGAESPLEQSDRDRAVRHAVMRLPTKYRDVVTVFYFHDMSVAQTALTLGLRAGTVKARLHRARALLSRKLATVPALPEPREES